MRWTSSARRVALVLLPLLGTPVGLSMAEGTPQVMDPAGDVRYSEAYPYGRDHDYLDVVAGWWRFHNESDVIEFGLQGVDFTAYASAPAADHAVACRLRFRAMLGEDFRGFLFVQLLALRGADAFTPSISLVDSVTEGMEGQPIPHELRATLTPAGEARFLVQRGALLGHLDQLRDGRLQCIEEYFPATEYPLKVGNSYVTPNPFSNADTSNATDQVLDLRALHPTSAPTSSDCEFEEACAEPANATAIASADANGATPGVPWLAAAALVGAVAWRRRATNTGI